jgi:hypothetical protein
MADKANGSKYSELVTPLQVEKPSKSPAPAVKNPIPASKPRDPLGILPGGK